MAYEYVTDNNLYEKQTYMYSKYRGMDFLRDYLASRCNYIDAEGSADEDILPCVKTSDDVVERELIDILQKMKAGDYSTEIVKAMNAYTKSFEVRKRIYSGYDNQWKPIEGIGFENYQNYLLFADCLLQMYWHTKCLKYFSCLLKVDDTLLSLRGRLSERLQKSFRRIISLELDVFHQLIRENGINGEVTE